MTNNINMISDDFSDEDNNAPSSSPKVADDARKLSSGSKAGLYAPTSDVMPIANPDPPQTRGVPPAPPQLSATDGGEPLFCAETSQRLH